MTALILTGPTGSGKSRLALHIAERAGAEIISMDSMALYRGMDVLTAKPTPRERDRVPHHLIDVLDPWESASVAWWLDRATACQREIEGRGKRVLYVGGTPLYMKALLFGLFEGAPADPGVRERLEDEAARDGFGALHRRLAAVDPAAAARLHPNDVRRVVRALEVWTLTGRPISDQQRQWAAPGDPQRFECYWLDLPRQALYARINARVGQMISDGVLDEVRRLTALPAPLSREAAQAIGYHEMAEVLAGASPLDEARGRMQTRSRQLAKRQLTWFRHCPACRPVGNDLTIRAWDLRIDTSGLLRSPSGSTELDFPSVLTCRAAPSVFKGTVP